MRFLLRSSAGLLLWALGFSVLYSLHGLGCESGWNEMPMPGGTLFGWVLVPTWALLCLGGAGIVRWAWAAPSGFARRLRLASALAGLAGTVITGAPVVLTSACV